MPQMVMHTLIVIILIIKCQNQIRNTLGVCFQHDVLFPILTTIEHLWLFATLKGILQQRVNDKINSIIKNGGLDVNNLKYKFPKGISIFINQSAYW